MVTGDDVLAADIAQISKNANDAGGFRDDINAGESITALRPVFLASSGKWNFSDADDATRLVFDGIALEAGTNNNPMKVQLAGIVRGLSSLTPGANYYVQDDGTIGTTPGTNSVLVGVAISATELLIKKIESVLPAVDGRNLILIKNATSFTVVESETAQLYPGEQKQEDHNDYSLTPRKKLEIQFNDVPGVIRVKHTMEVSDNNHFTMYSQIFVNGVARGTQRAITSSNTVLITQNYSEGVSVNTGDLVQLYVWSSVRPTGYYSSVYNFGVSFDKTLKIIPCTNLL
jgi:hypothetical protein